MSTIITGTPNRIPVVVSSYDVDAAFNGGCGPRVVLAVLIWLLALLLAWMLLAPECDEQSAPHRSSELLARARVTTGQATSEEIGKRSD